MPARTEILQEISAYGAQDVVRRRYLLELNKLTGRNVILYASGFASRPGNVPPFLFMVNPQDVQGFMSSIHGMNGDKLDLILHSPGGSLETTEQLVTYLRSKFTHIRAIIPQNAMSAATMLACACDEIIMGKQSAIGPIDPQITLPSKHGNFTASADAILEDFKKAKAEIEQNPRTAAIWMKILEAMPHGVLSHCENALNLSRQKVATWLEQYMKLEHDKAISIAEWLAKTEEHKTHGRPIGIELAQEKGLNVIALENDQKLQDAVLSVYHSTMITFESTPCVKLIENHSGKGLYLLFNPKQ